MRDLLSHYHSQWVENDQKAYYDVFWIMQHYLSIEWADLQTKNIDYYPKETIVKLEEAIKAYKVGKPLAYLLGNVDFYELNFQIKEGVLIPRADTEPMVSEIIKRLKGNERILELGTGSGAIACAIAHHMPKVKITAVEWSDVACDVAKKNVKQLGLEEQVRVVKENWYDLSLSGFDWVISNPPYIAKDDPHMMRSVYKYEPIEALESDDLGYKDLLYIINNAKRWLIPNGYIALEHGFMQQEAVKQALIECQYKNIHLGRDEVHPRYVIAGGL